MDDGAIIGLKTVEFWDACEKLRKTQILSVSIKRTFQSPEAELEKPLKLNCYVIVSVGPAGWFSGVAKTLMLQFSQIV